MQDNLCNRNVLVAAVFVAAALLAQPVFGQQQATSPGSESVMSPPAALELGGTPKSRLAGLPETPIAAKGLRVRIDPTTRRFLAGPPIPLDQLPEHVQARLLRSVQGLTPAVLANGATVVDFQGRFQTMSVVSLGQDGSKASACLDTPEALAALLARGSESVVESEKNNHEH